MSALLASVLHGEDLLRTVVASVVAGVGVMTAFSIAIWGGARFVDLSREGRALAAGAAALIGGLALLATLTALVVGIIVMTSK